MKSTNAINAVNIHAIFTTLIYSIVVFGGLREKTENSENQIVR